MAKFLIEVEHDAEPLACLNAIRVFLTTGSHFLARADWGCSDGEHKAWMIVDVDNKDEARRIVPSAYRDRTKVVLLDKFNIEDVETMIREHGG